MSKKIINYLTMILFIILISGCDNKKNYTETNKNETTDSIIEKENNEMLNLEEIYLSVIDNNRDYIDENNRETSINDFLKVVAGNTKDIKVSYALVDLDEDNENEFIALFDTWSGDYLVLNYEKDSGIVYGFPYGYRSMVAIKENGILLGTSGAEVNAYYRLFFDKNKVNDKEIASMDGNIYKIDGKEVSESEYQEYADKLSALENIVLKEYKTLNNSQAEDNN